MNDFSKSSTNFPVTPGLTRCLSLINGCYGKDANFIIVTISSLKKMPGLTRHDSPVFENLL